MKLLGMALFVVIQFCVLGNAEATSGIRGLELIAKPCFVSFAENVLVHDTAIAKNDGFDKIICRYSGRGGVASVSNGVRFGIGTFYNAPIGEINGKFLTNVFSGGVIDLLKTNSRDYLAENSRCLPYIFHLGGHGGFFEPFQSKAKFSLGPFYGFNSQVCLFNSLKSFSVFIGSFSGLFGSIDGISEMFGLNRHGYALSYEYKGLDGSYEDKPAGESSDSLIGSFYACLCLIILAGVLAYSGSWYGVNRGWLIGGLLIGCSLLTFALCFLWWGWLL